MQTKGKVTHMSQDIISEEIPDISEIRQIRRDKLSKLQEEKRDPFTETRYKRTAYSAEIINDFEAFDQKDVSIAGRLMSKRDMGKAFFADLMDDKGRIQLYVRVNDLGDEAFAEFKKWDIGDIVGAEGFAFRTRRGEISVHCKAIKLLSKSLLPLPEKFHGLTDLETRYRQRYVDLIMNPEVRRTFEIRSRFIRHIRAFLDNRGYMEVETPVLNTISGGATARPFITHHNSLDIDMYMRIATELHLKRLVVGGIERVYEIGRIFRNEGMDTKHNPEFTTVELYEAYSDFNDMMDLFEALLSSAAQDILGTYDLTWQGEAISLAPGWERLTMAEAVKKHLGVDFMSISSDEEAMALAKSVGVGLPAGKDPTWGNLLYECFDQKVEEKLVQPTFITMHPVDVSPLAKRSPTDPRLTERFEIFICHSEMGNAFSELNDPIDQKQRFQKQAEMRKKGDAEAGMMDEDFITALEYGLPPTGGLGIGIDRCVMLLAETDSIRDVILFPTMKPIDA
ncbi:MAG: lysine--tRNA ligase [Oscillospiraceae bacterium]